MFVPRFAMPVQKNARSILTWNIARDVQKNVKDVPKSAEQWQE
jgi:hypothetical protein